MRKCIYCLKSEDYVSFKKAEHILPKAFGKFINNTVFTGVVCDECNSYFGETIDKVLARDTIEGMDRFKFKIKDDSELKTEGKRSKYSIVALESIFEGASFYPEYDEKSKSIKIGLKAKQVGIKRMKDGKFDFFDISLIPSKDNIDLKYLDEKGRLEFFIDKDDKEIIPILIEKGYKTASEFIDYGVKELNNSNIKIEYSRELDNTLGRAIAKIAFSYLAYVYGENYLFNESFNPIRDFIHKGNGNVKDFVEFFNDDILKDDVGAEETIVAHIIAVRYEGNNVYGLVTLFNNVIKYKVYLAKNVGIVPSISAMGHMYNLADMEAKSLTTDNARELLKLIQKSGIFIE